MYEVVRWNVRGPFRGGRVGGVWNWRMELEYGIGGAADDCIFQKMKIYIKKGAFGIDPHPSLIIITV